MSHDSTVESGEEHPAVIVTGLAKSQGGRSLWSDISFTVEHGGSLAVTGPSGAGKSTLLHCISRLERHDHGAIEIDGASLDRMTGRQLRVLRSRTLGHLFQDYALVETWTVKRNLDVALIGERVKRADRLRRHSEALARVGLEGFLNRRVSTLSGGEQQRVALARLLVRRPTVILADEPSAALDDARAEAVLDVLSELRTSGAAVLVATHDPRVVDWCGKRVHLDAV